MEGVLALINTTSLVASSGYLAIFLLSVMQSCCVPTSSELTLGFAGYLAFTGKLSLPGVILVGASGEIAGAYAAWLIGRYAGRAFVDRWGRYILLTHHDLDRAENWYRRHPRWGVFGSRLLPVIRNFVAVPAGVAEVPAVRFGILTALGSLVWDGAMALIGYGLGSQWHAVMHGVSDAGYVIGALAALAIVAVIAHRWRSYKRYSAAERAGGPARFAAGAAAASQKRPRDPVADVLPGRLPPAGSAVRVVRPGAADEPPR